ncbi:chemotaxis-specific protein-glutamate methyltransferase CheB [Candidatus Riflebacteria bacterium]
MTAPENTSEILVLIVDDSRIFRNVIEKCLSDCPNIKVIGSVRNGVKALEFIKQKRPHIVTLDIEMPDMDGFQTQMELQRLNRNRKPGETPIGSIMVSGAHKEGAKITLDCLANGAFDFIEKPSTGGSPEAKMQNLQDQLVPRIKAYADRYIFKKKGRIPITIPPKKITVPKPAADLNIKALLIGVSTGGPKALMTLMPQISQALVLPIFVVQHMPPNFTESLAKSLDGVCMNHQVCEAGNMKAVQPNGMYIAPGGKHLILKRGGSGEIMTAWDNSPPESGCRPSVNVLFRSAAKIYGGEVIVLILTGMGNDGAESISVLKEKGAKILVQDEASSVVWGMPGAAVATGIVDEIIPLGRISERLSILSKSKGLLK